MPHVPDAEVSHIVEKLITVKYFAESLAGQFFINEMAAYNNSVPVGRWQQPSTWRRAICGSQLKQAAIERRRLGRATSLPIETHTLQMRSYLERLDANFR